MTPLWLTITLNILFYHMGNCRVFSISPFILLNNTSISILTLDCNTLQSKAETDYKQQIIVSNQETLSLIFIRTQQIIVSNQGTLSLICIRTQQIIVSLSEVRVYAI